VGDCVCVWGGGDETCMHICVRLRVCVHVRDYKYTSCACT
jgi:hypothetical protein